MWLEFLISHLQSIELRLNIFFESPAAHTKFSDKDLFEHLGSLNVVDDHEDDARLGFEYFHPL